MVDAFDPALLCGNVVTHTIDFQTATLKDLQSITVPLEFTCTETGRLTGGRSRMPLPVR